MTKRNDIAALRVDQVGSLLRPQSLIDAFLAFGHGRISREDLDRAIEAGTRAVVAKQEELGWPIVTDGEYGRINWQVSFSKVDGWDIDGVSWRATLAKPTLLHEHERPLSLAQDAVETFKTPATSRISLERSFPLAEYQRLRAITRSPVKAMLMGPDRVAQMCDLENSAPHYTDADLFLADVVRIQAEMVGGLVDAGCPYIQLDEPSYTGYVDPRTLERMRARGESPTARLERAIAASNGAIAPHRGKAVFGIHICRGNRASMWHREGSYDGIAERLFSTLAFDRLLLEYDSERAGGFEPLRFVPKGPIVVLGLVTTKTGVVERVDDLMRRIEEASRFIPVEQLALSPQCGFASGMGGNLLAEQEQWAKLKVIMETARRVWG